MQALSYFIGSEARGRRGAGLPPEKAGMAEPMGARRAKTVLAGDEARRRADGCAGAARPVCLTAGNPS